MKVQELIEALSALPPDAVVKTEGCACVGLADLPRIDGAFVIVARTPNCICDGHGSVYL